MTPEPKTIKKNFLHETEKVSIEPNIVTGIVALCICQPIIKENRASVKKELCFLVDGYTHRYHPRYHPAQVPGQGDIAKNCPYDPITPLTISLTRNKILLPILDMFHCFDLQWNRPFTPFPVWKRSR
jgi:hypothetical protein